MVSTAVTTNESARNGGELSEEEIFEVLSNRRRRFVIHALKRAEGPLEVSELSTHVTAWEVGVEPEEVRYEDRRNVYSTLQRTHLPKLEEKNVVTVDEETNVVAPTPELESLDIYVEVLGSREIPWSLYYVGLAGVAVSLLLAVATGTPGFAALEPLDVGVFTATTFGISAVVHHVIGRRARLGDTEKPPELRKRE
ncbi:transcriptional regulator [Halorubrum persicum]|uniref:Transcriptional regulator n=1 Tax=Halorubrum persicum TaxID=1383844 RepID=A0A2G1WGN1_9EURY|nr:transcriptional regulator [Halorubrum persicum]PHQ38168.1 transcriptional regulator [Halorubrum persicum]